jgi:hypothetical protein
MDVVEVVKEIMQLFQSMSLDHKCVIRIMEQTSGIIGHPAKCHLLKVASNSDEPMLTPLTEVVSQEEEEE